MFKRHLDLHLQFRGYTQVDDKTFFVRKQTIKLFNYFIYLLT